MSTYRFAITLLAACVLAACTASQPDLVRPSGATTYAPTQNVEVLENPPARPYVKIGDVDAAGEPGALRAQVLAQIRTQAQAIGADAVVLQDVSRPAPAMTRLNPTTGMYENTGGQLVPAFKGIAIKYR